MKLVLDWKKKLGYTRDPFETQIPLPIGQFLIGTSSLQEKCNLFLIKGQRFGTVASEKGHGKTMFLNWLAFAVSGQRGYKALVIDGASAVTSEGLLQEIAKGTAGFFSRTIGTRIGKEKVVQQQEIIERLKKGTYLLLIDNAAALHKEALETLSAIMQSSPAHVIVADTPERLKRIAFEQKDELAITLPQYTKDNLVELLHRRIAAAGGSGTFPFAQEDLDHLVKKSDGNPVKLLQLSRERAIELSLKVGTPPRPVAHAAAQEQSSGGKFFSIRIDRGTAQEEHTSAPVHSTNVPVHESTQEMQEDAQKLFEIVEQTDPERNEPAAPAQPTTSHDDLIKSVARDLDTHPKKGAKKKAKRH